MKKLFNNSTKGNETQNQSIKSKRKFLRTFSFTSLALLMGSAGVFAFAPLGANSNNLASANTLSNEINTKADGENIKYAPSALGLDPENDPVIYTTESGLEIKYGGESVSDQLASGKPLSGYPYFTMGTYGGYAVNWVIIGRNTNDTVFTSAISAYLYSTWKTNNNVSSSTFTTKAKYWFNGGGYETTTPAGSAINGVVPSKSYVADVTKATKTVVGNDEVPSGCVLAITESLLGGSTFNVTDGGTTWEQGSGSPRGGRYRYLSTNTGTKGTTFTYSTTGGVLYTKMVNLYNSELGLTSTEKLLIQPQKLQTAYCNGNSHYLETSSTDGNTSYYLFPLAGFDTDDSYSSSINPGTETFKMTTYLTSHALRQAYEIGTTTARGYWLRSGEPTYSYAAIFIPTSTSASERGAGSHAFYGVRPACVIKLG